MTSIRRRTAAFFALGALVLSACGGTDSSTEPTDNGDLAGTSITVYSGRSEALMQELYELFTQETGITVNARYGDSGELAATILTEGSASPTDVFFSQDAGALGAIEDLFAPLSSDILSAVDAKFSADSGKWVGVSGRVRVVVYNPDLVDVAPTTVDELVDPKWKGKIGFAPTNASWQSFVTAMRVLRGDQATQTWLEDFAANDPKPYDKNAALRDGVNAGEVALGLTNHYYLLEKIAAEGAANVKAKNQHMAAGDPGGLLNVAGVGIITTSKNSAGAQAFVKFLQSETAAEYFRTKTWEYVLTSGAIQAEGQPTLDELNVPALDLSDLKTLEATQELLQKVGLLTK